MLLIALAAQGAYAFNALYPFEFNTAGNAGGWVPTSTTFVVNPLFPFPDRLPSVFSALGEKANS
jgi:hypothetical protein